MKPIHVVAWRSYPPIPPCLSSLSSPRLVLAAENPCKHWDYRALRTCVKGRYAALDGITSLHKTDTHITRARYIYPPQSHSICPATNQLHNCHKGHCAWSGSGAIIGSSNRITPTHRLCSPHHDHRLLPLLLRRFSSCPHQQRRTFVRL